MSVLTLLAVKDLSFSKALKFLTNKSTFVNAFPALCMPNNLFFQLFVMFLLIIIKSNKNVSLFRQAFEPNYMVNRTMCTDIFNFGSISPEFYSCTFRSLAGGPYGQAQSSPECKPRGESLLASKKSTQQTHFS